MKKIKNFFGTLPRFLVEKSFLTFLFLLAIFLLLSGFVFFKYSVLADKQALKVSDKSLIFESQLYENILQIWQERKEKFETADKKEYQNLFGAMK